MRTKGKNCWYARLAVTDANGKRRNLKKRGSSEAEARKKLRILTQQIEEEGSKAVDFAKLTFNHLAEYYERHYLKPAEYVEDRKISGLRDVERPGGFLPHFRAYIGKKNLREITYGDIYTYRSLRLQTPTKYKRPRSIADWNREAAVLRRMLNIVMREGWILKNPSRLKEVLGMWAAEAEGAEFWMQVVTELKNRGVQDIFIACVGGLKGTLPTLFNSHDFIRGQGVKLVDYGINSFV
jgi:hypothetical protein